MTPKEHRAQVLATARAMYDEVDLHTREDLGAALDWARDKLMRKEGEGHTFHVTPVHYPEGYMTCSFSKASWGGDHCGSPMELASEAIVLATCEYLVGG